MQNEEKEISELVAEWHKRAAVGELEKILSLMTDDVIFYIVGQPIRGKESVCGRIPSGYSAFSHRIERKHRGDRTDPATLRTLQVT
jgi:ketosteroid isomerase-like protein